MHRAGLVIALLAIALAPVGAGSLHHRVEPLERRGDRRARRRRGLGEAEDLLRVGVRLHQQDHVRAELLDGKVVGEAQTPFGPHAFLWTGSTMYDLNLFVADLQGLELVDARAINASGQIAGNAIGAAGARAGPLEVAPHPDIGEADTEHDQEDQDLDESGGTVSRGDGAADRPGGPRAPPTAHGTPERDCRRPGRRGPDRPRHQHVVITGRGAPQPLIEIADTVTEMRPVKHAFDAGIKAQKGIVARTATLDQKDHGLSDKRLADTDVMIWWGHCAHGAVEDEIVKRVRQRRSGRIGPGR